MQRKLKPRSGKMFHRSIVSEDWYLWDNFGYRDAQGIHIFSLAADKNTELTQEQRHSAAYWRHFVSRDEGATWCDRGPVLSSSNDQGAYDSYTIWSGSVLKRDDGLVVAAYTGLKKGALALQSMAIAVSQDGSSFEKVSPQRPLLSAHLDYEVLRSRGYYLGPKETIGDTDREADGTFLCFRDPFLFIDENRKTHLFFAAKTRRGNRIVGALGHAVFTDESQLNFVDILAPQLVPDAEEFNLFELPNVFTREGFYYLVVSTSRLAHFGQPDLDAQKAVRIYRSRSLNGPWQPYGANGRYILLNPESKLHGLNIVHDSRNTTNMLTCRAFRVGESNLPPSLVLSVGGPDPELIFPDDLWPPGEKPVSGI